MEENKLEYNEEMLDSDETLSEVEQRILEDLSRRADVVNKLNRAQKRALMKKGKRKELSTINETAKKLTQIGLIQKLRELNEKKEKEENEATQD